MTENVRIPAHDLDAEAVVLSAIFERPERFYDIQPILNSRAFYSDANRRIFEAIERLESERKGIDVTAVATVLRDSDRLGQIGGTPYLAQLIDSTPATANLADHARTVAGKAHQRRLVAELQRHAAEGYGDVGDPWEWSQRVEEGVYAAASDRVGVDDNGTMAVVVPDALSELDARRRNESEAPGIRTGFTELDSRLNGLKRGKTYIVAGRPGMGKTSLTGQIGTNIAAGDGQQEQMFVVEISTEQKRSELALRKIAQTARVSYKALEAAQALTEKQWERVYTKAEWLRKLPLSIDFLVAPTIGEIRSAIRRAVGKLRMQCGSLQLGLISIDQLQHLDAQSRKGENRESEVARLSREIQWMAGEFDCPLILDAQLNRGPDDRPDKRPIMRDLRESGAIEQDAYGILFPFRPKYYERAERGDSNDATEIEECEVIVGKHKNGPAGSVALSFHAPSMAFGNADPYARRQTGMFQGR
jgi:replicative DNA helicase